MTDIRVILDDPVTFSRIVFSGVEVKVGGVRKGIRNESLATRLLARNRADTLLGATFRAELLHSEVTDVCGLCVLRESRSSNEGNGSLYEPIAVGGLTGIRHGELAVR
jgi:hypothetical protein